MNNKKTRKKNSSQMNLKKNWVHFVYQEILIERLLATDCKQPTHDEAWTIKWNNKKLF